MPRRIQPPEDPMTAFVSKHWTLLYRIGLIMGVGYTGATVKGTLMTRAELFDALAPITAQSRENGEKLDNAVGRVTVIERTLAVMAEQQKAIQRQDEIQRDFEMRLRAMERTGR